MSECHEPRGTRSNGLIGPASRTYFQDHHHAFFHVDLVDYPPVTYPDPEDSLQALELLNVEELDWGERLLQRVQRFYAPPLDVFRRLIQTLACPLRQDDAIQLLFSDSLPNLAPLFCFAL